MSLSKARNDSFCTMNTGPQVFFAKLGRPLPGARQMRPNSEAHSETVHVSFRYPHFKPACRKQRDLYAIFVNLPPAPTYETARRGMHD